WGQDSPYKTLYIKFTLARRPGMGEPARASGPETRSRDKGRKKLRLVMVGGDVAPPGPNHAQGVRHTKSKYNPEGFASLRKASSPPLEHHLCRTTCALYTAFLRWRRALVFFFSFQSAVDSFPLFQAQDQEQATRATRNKQLQPLERHGPYQADSPQVHRWQGPA
ncbi:hypothetical protein L915_16599, partial [Phytophthora nicotianae]